VRTAIIAISIVWGATFGQAQINTDRPAVTDSSAVVPKWMFQVENGFLDTHDQGSWTFDNPETLIRFGAASSTELRFTAPDYYQHAGFGDFAFGVKQQLYSKPDGFEASAVVMLSVPTGAHGTSSHGYDPSLQLPWSHKLSANWTAAGMLSLYVPTVNGTHRVVGESTFLVDRQLTQPWDAFVEYAGDFPQTGGPRHLLHLGTSCKITTQQQLDFHVGIGLSAAALDRFVGVGYSFLFKLRR
jgi:hypothetical protein